MKKLLYSVSTALLLLSCSTEDPSLEAEPGKGGNVITFVGRTSPETRTEIGGKEGNSYPVLWSPGDGSASSLRSKPFSRTPARR